MQSWTSFALVALVVLAFLCCKTQTEGLTVESVEIRCKDLSALARWYTEILDFSPVTASDSLHVLQRNGFGIQIRPLSNTSNVASLPPYRYRDGLMKVGFTIQDLEEWVRTLTADSVNIRGSIFYDENLGQNSVIILDPEGNRIQFFEDTSRQQFSHCFLAVVTPDIEASLSFYSKLWNMQLIADLDLEERNIFIRLLGNEEGRIMELISLPGLTMPVLHENWSQLTGYSTVQYSDHLDPAKILAPSGIYLERTGR